MNTRDITGEKYNRLTAISFSHKSKGGLHYWTFLCDCGKKACIQKSAVINGYTRSCCGGVKTRFESTHGMTNTRFYKVWHNMKERCLNDKDQGYKRYGGRGIEVCDKWLEFVNFKNDMSASYEEGLSIDRIDVNGNYCKENCRWATMYEQGNNRTNSVLLSFDGKRMTASQWSKELGFSKNTIYERLKKGWSVDRTLTTKTI